MNINKYPSIDSLSKCVNMYICFSATKGGITTYSFTKAFTCAECTA